MIGIQNLLQKIDQASLPFVSNIILQKPENNPRQAVWPTTIDSDRTLLSLQERIPKAANASDTVMRYITPVDATSQYKAQEKLNGVYVLWKQGFFLQKHILSEMATRCGRRPVILWMLRVTFSNVYHLPLPLWGNCSSGMATMSSNLQA